MSVVLLCVGIRCSNMMMTKQVTDFLFVIFLQRFAEMGTSDCVEVHHNTKGGWRCALTRSGGRFVARGGTSGMQQLCADSSAIPLKARGSLRLLLSHTK